jgi:hypothetical protein
MNGMKSWMLGAAVLAGVMGMGAGTAQAAEFGIYARGPAAYAPPSPGPGYEWVAGYQSNGYWVPGRWAFRAHREFVERERVVHHDRYMERRDERFRDRRW